MRRTTNVTKETKKTSNKGENIMKEQKTTKRMTVAELHKMVMLQSDIIDKHTTDIETMKKDIEMLKGNIPMNARVSEPNKETPTPSESTEETKTPTPRAEVLKGIGNYKCTEEDMKYARVRDISNVDPYKVTKNGKNNWSYYYTVRKNFILSVCGAKVWNGKVTFKSDEHRRWYNDAKVLRNEIFAYFNEKLPYTVEATIVAEENK